MATETKEVKSASLETMVDEIIGKQGEDEGINRDSLRCTWDGGGGEENDMPLENDGQIQDGTLPSSGSKEEGGEKCTVCHYIGSLFSFNWCNRWLHKSCAQSTDPFLCTFCLWKEQLTDRDDKSDS